MWLDRRTAIIERSAQVLKQNGVLFTDVYRCQRGCLIWCIGADVEAEVRMTFWLVQVVELQ